MKLETIANELKNNGMNVQFVSKNCIEFIGKNDKQLEVEGTITCVDEANNMFAYSVMSERLDENNIRTINNSNYKQVLDEIMLNFDTVEL